MSVETSYRRAIWLLILIAAGLGLALLAACGTSRQPDVTPTPTRTPRPTATPTPSPTPTPIWPLTLSIAPEVPADARATLESAVADRDDLFTLIQDSVAADVRVTLGSHGGTVLGEWFYTLAAPFPTITDEVLGADLLAAWRGEPTSADLPFAGQPLLMDGETHTALSTLLDTSAEGAVTILPSNEVLGAAWASQPAWAIVPFHQLEPRWKVLSIDGRSVLERELDDEAYPLRIDIGVEGFGLGAEQLQELVGTVNNRDEEQMTVLVMTGVTALTRGIAQLMEQQGTLYPAQDIGDWLREADLTHVSNEVSFTPNCPVPPALGGTTFCSHDRYIELLEAVEVDIIELTGNHLNDHGVEPLANSLRMYRERGWHWFGGGANLADATRPLTLTHGAHSFAFLGCNPVGPSYDWATVDSPGSAPCDWDALRALVADLRARGLLPIVTIQAYETYEYFPTEQQVEDFRSLAEAGAVIVQGSQAHQPQGFDFRHGAFIDYGLGNLFFDQMQTLGTRQEIVDRHVFYAGRHLSVELLTALLEEYGRPRPTTPEERSELLQSVFAGSRWD